MYCSICTNARAAEIVEDYMYRGSLRKTAQLFNVGYRSLQRHIDQCIASIYAELEEQEFQREFEETAAYLRWHFGKKVKKTRAKSIVKKSVEYSWSRRAWSRKA